MIQEYSGKINDFDNFLSFLNAMAKVISEMFGPNCEVCVSDIDNEEHSVLAIYNGSVTGREAGAPLMPQSRGRLKHASESLGEEYVINYKKNALRNAKAVKSSTVLLHVGGRNLSFCINYDCTELENLEFALKSFLSMSDDRYDVQEIAKPSTLSTQGLISGELEQIKKPPQQLSTKERVALVSALHRKGLFEMRNSIPVLADTLGVSRYTIYNYLKKME